MKIAVAVVVVIAASGCATSQLGLNPPPATTSLATRQAFFDHNAGVTVVGAPDGTGKTLFSSGPGGSTVPFVQMRDGRRLGDVRDVLAVNGPQSPSGAAAQRSLDATGRARLLYGSGAVGATIGLGLEIAGLIVFLLPSRDVDWMTADALVVGGASVGVASVLALMLPGAHEAEVAEEEHATAMVLYRDDLRHTLRLDEPSPLPTQIE